MKKFVPLPKIETSLYIFGGHRRTVAGGWSFFKQKHQAFELMCIVAGHQTTKIGNQPEMTYGPGDVLIISPGSEHTNWNASQDEDMTYCCFHFNIESLKLKSEIIKSVANIVIDSNKALAKVAMNTANEMLSLSMNKKLPDEERNIKIEIVFLNFLVGLSRTINEFTDQHDSEYTEREAKVARSMATIIKARIEETNPESVNISEICLSLNISKGYGYRVFKKVYGITPLHFVEEQKYRKAKMLLGLPDYSVEEVGYMIGFHSLANFSKQFKKWSDISPIKYQQQAMHKRKVRGVKDSGFFE